MRDTPMPFAPSIANGCQCKCTAPQKLAKRANVKPGTLLNIDLRFEVIINIAAFGIWGHFVGNLRGPYSRDWCSTNGPRPTWAFRILTLKYCWLCRRDLYNVTKEETLNHMRDAHIIQDVFC